MNISSSISHVEALHASHAFADRLQAEFEKINDARFLLLGKIDQMSQLHGETMQKICALLVQSYKSEERHERQEQYEIIKNSYASPIASWISHCDASRQHVGKLRELLQLILIEDYQI